MRPDYWRFLSRNAYKELGECLFYAEATLGSGSMQCRARKTREKVALCCCCCSVCFSNAGRRASSRPAMVSAMTLKTKRDMGCVLSSSSSRPSSLLTRIKKSHTTTEKENREQHGNRRTSGKSRAFFYKVRERGKRGREEGCGVFFVCE